jgi:hypothetical protein
MKLSKLTLEWLIYHAQHSKVAGVTELMILEKINEALSDNTLEIDGHERSQWVKFDPQNPNTFPEKGEFILVCFYIADPSDGFIGVRGEAIIFDEKFIETINWQLNGFSSVELKDVLAWKKIDLSYPYELVSARLDELEKETRLDWNIEYDA